MYLMHIKYICRFITNCFCVQSQITGNQLLDAEAIDQIIFCDFFGDTFIGKSRITLGKKVTSHVEFSAATTEMNHRHPMAIIDFGTQCPLKTLPVMYEHTFQTVAEFFYFALTKYPYSAC